MGWRDRPYARSDYEDERPPRQGGMMGGMPRPGRVVGRLLIINILVFFVGTIFLRTPQGGRRLPDWFAVIPDQSWQIWRYVTFQFLHGGVGHLFFNMLALYFLGMLLEQAWGGRRFLVFYLGCGVVAGLAHVVMTPILNQPAYVRLVGASGGVYGVLLACAVMFPQIRVFIYFLFPVPIRVVAAVFLGIAVFNVVQGIRVAMAGGMLSGGISHPAHLGGAAAAAVYIWIWPALQQRFRLPRRAGGAGRWDKKLRQRRRTEEQVDRILDKIRRRGLGSLNWSERRTLRKASRQQADEEGML